MAEENSQRKRKEMDSRYFQIIHFHLKKKKSKPHFIPEKQGFAVVIKKISELQIHRTFAKRGK